MVLPSVKVDSTKARAPSYVADILLGSLAILLCLEVFAWIAAIPIALSGRADFRQLYAAGYMVRTGQRHLLYDYEAQKRVQDALVTQQELAMPFIRPAYQALLFVPLSLLSYRSAYFVFLGVNVVFVSICSWLLRPRMIQLAAIWRRLPAALFLAFFPISVALMQGQDSIILLLLLTLALGAFDRGREGTAGALVGLGLFKFQIVLPIGLLFLAWRRWRFSTGFMLAAALVAATLVGVAGVGATRAFANSLLSQGAGLSSAEHPSLPLVVTLMGNLRGLVFGIAGSMVSPFWLQVVTTALSGAVFVAVGFSARQNQGNSDVLALAITASAVVSYYLFIHDLTVLLIPLVMTLERHIMAEPSGDAFGSLVAGVAVLLYVSPICSLLNPGYFYLVALPLIGFLFIMMRSFRRGNGESQHYRIPVTPGHP